MVYSFKIQKNEYHHDVQWVIYLYVSVILKTNITFKYPSHQISMVGGGGPNFFVKKVKKVKNI